MPRPQVRKRTRPATRSTLAPSVAACPTVSTIHDQQTDENQVPGTPPALLLAAGATSTPMHSPVRARKIVSPLSDDPFGFNDILNVRAKTRPIGSPKKPNDGFSIYEDSSSPIQLSSSPPVRVLSSSPSVARSPLKPLSATELLSRMPAVAKKKDLSDDDIEDENDEDYGKHRRRPKKRRIRQASERPEEDIIELDEEDPEEDLQLQAKLQVLKKQFDEIDRWEMQEEIVSGSSQ
jgi:hypothetical protein